MQALEHTRQSFITMLLQPVATAKAYTWAKARADIIAGLTVAVVMLPQSMAFALIAGVPPQYGLYAAMFQGILGSLWSPSDHLSIGPTNTQSLLTAAAVHRLVGADDPAVYVQLVVFLTMLKGFIQLAFAAARLGGLVRYVSQSVIVGFTAGAGVLIAVGQIPNFLDIKLGPVIHGLPGIIDKAARLWPNLGQTHWRAVALGLGAMVVALLCKRISKLIPGPLLGVGGAAVLVGVLGWTSGQLTLVGQLPLGLPHMVWPWLGWARAEEMLAGAAAIALLGMIESVAIGKSIAHQTGQRLDADQEFLAQGLTNILTSFFQCVPGSGSFSRSALNFQVGAATRFAGLICAVTVTVVFLLLGSLTRFIPLTALAAILFLVAWQLIDFRYLKQVLRGSRADAAICLITFAATLFLPLEYAIYVGVLLNIGWHVRQSSRLHLSEMVAGRGAPFDERPITDRTGRRAVIFLSLSGDLFFGLADELQDHLLTMSASGVRVVILRIKRTHMIDATVMHVFLRFVQDLQQRGGHVIFCGVHPEIMAMMQHFGLRDLVGEENIFPTQSGLFVSSREALARARELVGQSIDINPILRQEQAEQQLEPWYYQI